MKKNVVKAISGMCLCLTISMGILSMECDAVTNTYLVGGLRWSGKDSAKVCTVSTTPTKGQNLYGSAEVILYETVGGKKLLLTSGGKFAEEKDKKVEAKTAKKVEKKKISSISTRHYASEGLWGSGQRYGDTGYVEGKYGDTY